VLFGAVRALLEALFGVPCGCSGCNAGAVRGAVRALVGVQRGRCSAP